MSFFSSVIKLTYISLFTAPCEPNPCLNGGTCMVGPNNTAVCTCTPQFEGELCEIPRKSFNAAQQKELALYCQLSRFAAIVVDVLYCNNLLCLFPRYNSCLIPCNGFRKATFVLDHCSETFFYLIYSILHSNKPITKN